MKYAIVAPKLLGLAVLIVIATVFAIINEAFGLFHDH
jgi:hypothetical protein